MPTLRNFNSSQSITLRKDIEKAVKLCMHCNNRLLLTHGGLPRSTLSLLSDTFGFSTEDREKIDFLRNKFLALNMRLARTKYIGTQKHRGNKKEMGFNAFVIPSRPTEINIVNPHYFSMKSEKERVSTLIHEGIHLIFPKVGHPGKIPLVFERTSLGIPYEKAKKNAYCYQYFAEWIK